MSTHEDLLAAVRFLRDRTGDPNAWQKGLTPAEVAAVVTPTARPQQLTAILGKIHRQHSELFNVGRPPGSGALPDPETGAAAQAIAQAESALAHQNSASSQLDLQVVSAILNAHLKTLEGKEALTQLQRETEAAVQTRSDLDTPAGARDFQRFLIGKLRDIRAIVLNASLDDTSKSALMAAWTSLYGASHGDADGSDANPPATGATGGDPETGWDPLLDSLLADDAGPPGADSSEQRSAEGAAAPPPPSAPAIPAIPAFGAGPLPGLGSAPGSLADWGFPSSGARDDGPDPALAGLDDEALPGPEDPDAGDQAASEHQDDERPSADTVESPPAGPTTLTLPDGETVTAGSPQLAAAITAAVSGTPIAEAFHRQGITIPPPGTAVADPLDPPDVTPGDIGMFTDRHALALGPGKALLDGQIQHIATVSGPGFLGWEHPPAASTLATAPAGPDAPTPTRPATTRP